MVTEHAIFHFSLCSSFLFFPFRFYSIYFTTFVCFADRNFRLFFPSSRVFGDSVKSVTVCWFVISKIHNEGIVKLKSFAFQLEYKVQVTGLSYFLFAMKFVERTNDNKPAKKTYEMLSVPIILILKIRIICWRNHKSVRQCLANVRNVSQCRLYFISFFFFRYKNTRPEILTFSIRYCK